MKYSIAVAATVLAAVAHAQLPDVPACSQSCFLTALSTDGCSSITDFKCHCANTGLISQIQPCVKKACPNQSDQDKVNSQVKSVCQGVGVPISIPGDTGSSPSSGSSSSSAASSAPASSAPAASSGSPSAPPKGASTAGTTLTSTSSVSSCSCSASAGAAAPSASIPHTNITTSPIPFTGAASQVAASAFTGAVAIVLAAFYIM